MKIYDVKKTDDGSDSLYCHTYGEATHSDAGAIAETVHHYIDPCKINERSKKINQLTILEMGFGIGHGFDQTLKAMSNNSYLRFVSFEKNKEFINYAKSLFPYLEKLEESSYSTIPSFTLKTETFELDIVFGDARENLQTISAIELEHKFQSIYQDPFSPKRNPRLWTLEWFKDLYKVASDDCIMSTYSASSSVRKAMVASNWKVRSERAFGHKKSFTIAMVNGESDPDILQHLDRSPANYYLDSDY